MMIMLLTPELYNTHDAVLSRTIEEVADLQNKTSPYGRFPASGFPAKTFLSNEIVFCIKDMESSCSETRQKKKYEEMASNINDYH